MQVRSAACQRNRYWRLGMAEMHCYAASGVAVIGVRTFLLVRNCIERCIVPCMLCMLYVCIRRIASMFPSVFKGNAISMKCQGGQCLSLAGSHVLAQGMTFTAALPLTFCFLVVTSVNDCYWHAGGFEPQFSADLSHSLKVSLSTIAVISRRLFS